MPTAGRVRVGSYVLGADKVWRKVEVVTVVTTHKCQFVMLTFDDGVSTYYNLDDKVAVRRE